MKITEVRITPAHDAGRFKAYTTIKFDDCFVVRGLRLIEGQQRWFVAMPDKRIKEGAYIDMAYPLGKEMRERIEAAVIDEYKKVAGNSPLYKGGAGGDFAA